jgi:hypothetical protein
VLEEGIVLARERIPRLGLDLGDALYDGDFDESRVAGVIKKQPHPRAFARERLANLSPT